MRRREFFAQTVVAGVLWPLAGLAQQPAVRRRIAVLTPGTGLSKSFVQELRALGYGDADIAIDTRATAGRLETFPDLAAELVRLAPEVVVAVTPRAVAAVRQASSTIPIVMVDIADPIAAGFVTSLAHPGGNITGLANLAQDTAGKRLELLKTAIPSARRVAVLFNPGNPGNVRQLQATQQVALSLGVELLPVEAPTTDAIDSAFATMGREHADALFVADDPVYFFVPGRISELALGLKLPAIFQSRGYVDAGELMSYGTGPNELIRRAADYVDKILKGMKPADLPVEQPTKFELVINLKCAKMLGLTVPPTLLAGAAEVIE